MGNHSPDILILMATYNGAKFLAIQLQSIENQTYGQWRILISDDGSTDDTLSIALKFQQKWGSDRVQIRKGPENGFSENFLSMACDESVSADLYAFCDQDDFWMDNKLAIAVKHFNENIDSTFPMLYCGRTIITDEKLNPVGRSPLFTFPRSFRNAIVQSIAGGNTMVFNQRAKELLEASGKQDVVAHDWWLYQIVTGVGGEVFYDPQPLVLYRQHPDNLIGENNSISAKLNRILFILKGGFKSWNDINYDSLMRVSYLFTKDNQQVLNMFGIFRKASFKDRIRLLQVTGIYRQTWRDTLNLWVALVFKKV